MAEQQQLVMFQQGCVFEHVHVVGAHKQNKPTIRRTRLLFDCCCECGSVVAIDTDLS